MTLHFSQPEFERRQEKTRAAMAERGLDALLIFAQESMYWLTGYDTFGFCFFQCLVLTSDGRLTLLTRAADQRQAELTSNLTDIRIWADRGEATPVLQLKEILFDLDLLGSRLGVEFDTHGLTAANGRQLDEHLQTFGEMEDASNMIPALRLIKSVAEIAFIRDAARLADAAWDAGLAEIAPGANEAKVLAAMQGAVFEGGGDYPGNSFILGSGENALLCRYATGRRHLSDVDQVTLEFAGVYRHYHVAMMRTVPVGTASARHLELFEACREALDAVEEAMRPGQTFGDVFDAHAAEMDSRGLHPHRLNACGYSLGARFAPSWMDWPMFYRGNKVEIQPHMTLFAHMILMDSETGTAMTLGQTYLTTEAAPESLSKASLDLAVR